MSSRMRRKASGEKELSTRSLPSALALLRIASWLVSKMKPLGLSSLFGLLQDQRLRPNLPPH